ncbi:gamma-butyrobetaine hydroxylase-like domain-containing protein [Methylobacterium planeticum]|uniref:DUF971 domain-containing protein n=1 Tax=Methylobacterium planeticum TaxID=2615211 RepID=A0A6N6MKQ9_9HYPH|nr:DUF971 domain-containing protein [Methylobacterium planeticum]KAB1070276.1 DUF971 domain-containing protein [Methylobacterium planeticum]
MASGVTRLPAQPPFDPTATPDEVVLARAGASLRLTWRDGATAVLAAETLRLHCRCAWCTRDRVQGHFPLEFKAVAVKHIEPMGTYAAHITFSDGHVRGIFPWVYLRDLTREAPDADAA